MSSYFVNSLSCYSQSVADGGGGGECPRDYPQANSPYRAYNAVASPGAYPNYHASLAPSSNTQNGDYYTMNSQRLCHPPLGSRESRSPPTSGVPLTNSRTLAVTRGSPPPAHLSGSYHHGIASSLNSIPGSRNTYSPSSGSEASCELSGTDMSTTVKTMSPPPAHVHRTAPPTTPTKPIPAHTKPITNNTTGSSPQTILNNDSARSEDEKSPISTDKAPTVTSGQNSGSEASTKGDGDNDSESGNKPQIYPWMRRMHLGHGKNYCN